MNIRRTVLPLLWPGLSPTYSPSSPTWGHSWSPAPIISSRARLRGRQRWSREGEGIFHTIFYSSAVKECPPLSIIQAYCQNPHPNSSLVFIAYLPALPSFDPVDGEDARQVDRLPLPRGSGGGAPVVPAAASAAGFGRGGVG